jgi:hypothetical protein
VTPRQSELRTLALALLASLLLWNLPFGGLLLYPFKLLATWIHELSHGIAMLACGVGLDRLDIFRDTSGMAHARAATGSAVGSAVIAAAGYMGTPLWGAALLVIASTATAARRALLVLAAALLVTAIVVVANPFGQYAIAAIGIGVAVAALLLPARGVLAVAHFLAAQACVNALLDIRVLLRPTQVVDGVPLAESDATHMAASTFGTTADWAVWTWAVIWLVWSLAVLYVALRVNARRASTSAAASAPTTETPPAGSDPRAPRRSPASARGETGPTGSAGT